MKKKTVVVDERDRELERKFQAEARVMLGARSDIMGIRISTGVYAVPGKPDQRVRSAPDGTPDWIGVWKRQVTRSESVAVNSYQPLTKVYEWPYGQALAIEFKRRKGGKQSKEQKAFERVWCAAGGIYLMPRKMEDILAVIGHDPQETTGK